MRAGCPKCPQGPLPGAPSSGSVLVAPPALMGLESVRSAGRACEAATDVDAPPRLVPRVHPRVGPWVALRGATARRGGAQKRVSAGVGPRARAPRSAGGSSAASSRCPGAAPHACAVARALSAEPTWTGPIGNGRPGHGRGSSPGARGYAGGTEDASPPTVTAVVRSPLASTPRTPTPTVAFHFPEVRSQRRRCARP